MNILFLATWFPYPPDNGSKLRVYYLLKALAEKHPVTLVSYLFGTSRSDHVTDMTGFHSDIHTLSIDPFKRSYMERALRFFSPCPIVELPLPETSRLVSRLVTQNCYDVVVASTGIMAHYARLLPRSTVKVIEQHNSMTRWMWERHLEQRSLLQRFRCWMSWQKSRLHEAHQFNEFDLCIMVSEQDRDTCLRDLPGYHGPVEIVPNGVDTDLNRPGLAEPIPDTLVFNGSLTYSANYDAMRFFLSEVYPLVRARVPTASLTITGSYQGVDLSGLKIDETIHFSGYVEDVRPYVARAAVCVAPIRQGGGTRLKILEAMALGTPVVATNKAAEGLAVTNGEHLLLADTPTLLSGHVVRLLGNSAECRRLAMNARYLAEQQYDWKAIGQGFVGLLESTVKERYTHDGI